MRGQLSHGSVHARFCLIVLGLCCVFVTASCSSRTTSPFAITRAEEGDAGRYMGGGTQLGGRRLPHEGTWARDFTIFDPLHLAELQWSHNEAFDQGGVGCY